MFIMLHTTLKDQCVVSDSVASYGQRACCEHQCYYHAQPRGLNATNVTVGFCCSNVFISSIPCRASRPLQNVTHWAFAYKMHERKKLKGAAIHNLLFMVWIALQDFVVSIIILQYFHLMIFSWHFWRFFCGCYCHPIPFTMLRHAAWSVFVICCCVFHNSVIMHSNISTKTFEQFRLVLSVTTPWSSNMSPWFLSTGFVQS